MCLGIWITTCDPVRPAILDARIESIRFSRVGSVRCVGRAGKSNLLTADSFFTYQRDESSPEPFEGGVFDDGFVEGHAIYSALACSS
jgi:hypothetical protein